MSKEMPRSGINGLFRPARMKRGIYSQGESVRARGQVDWGGETNHVHRGQNPRAIPQLAGDIFVGAGEGDINNAEDDVGDEVRGEEEKLEASGQGADVDSRAELDLAVVSFAQDWGVKNVAFDEGKVR